MLKLFDTTLKALQEGAFDMSYHQKRYLVTKHTQLEGKLIKLYGEELGGTNFISLNYYPYIQGGLLKPCEMPKQKVIDFVLGVSYV